MLKRIYVNNYKCLVNFEWKTGDSRSALLMGANGTGKTSISDVFLFLRDIGRGEIDTGKIGMSDSVPLSPLMAWNGRGKEDEPMQFEIDVGLGGNLFSYGLSLDLPKTFTRFRVTSEYLRQNGKPLFQRDRANVSIISLHGDPIDISHDWHSIFLPTFQNAIESGPVNSFKEWLSRILILAPVPSLMSGELKGDGKFLSRNTSDIADWVISLQSRDSELSVQVNNRMREVFPDFKSFGVRKILPNAKYGKDYLFLKFQGDKISEIPFFLLSDGMKCFFLSALLPVVVSLEPSAFCFWDEPDAHLSLSEVENFIGTLRKTFANRGQCIVTSHHPETMNGYPEDESWLLIRKDNLTATRPPLTLAEYRKEKSFCGNVQNAWMLGDIGNE